MINEVTTHENALHFWIVSFELWELNSLNIIVIIFGSPVKGVVYVGCSQNLHCPYLNLNNARESETEIEFTST